MTNFKSNDERNRFLLYYFSTEIFKEKGLSQTDAKKATKELIKKHSKNLFGKYGLAYIIGKNNFTFFCMYFLQDIFVPKENNANRQLAQVHYDVWKELQKLFIEDKYDREEFIIARGCAKSTIINKALSCWLMCYQKSRFTIVIGNKDRDAMQFIDATKQLLKNQYIVKTFGKLIDERTRTVNKVEIETTNDCDLQAFGANSSVRGATYSCSDGVFRPMVFIVDDILDEKDILTDNAKDKIVDKFYNEIIPAGDERVVRDGKVIRSATKVLVIGTPLSVDDFTNTIKTDPTFKVFYRALVDFNVDDYFENNEYWQHYKNILLDTKIIPEKKDIMLAEYYSAHKNKMIYPTIWEKYECDKLANTYFTKRTTFMQEYMCACENVGEKWFKSIRVMDEKEINENKFTATMLCVDPASTTKKSSDYCGFVVGSKSENGFMFVRKGIIEKLSFNHYCQKVIDLFKEYPDITNVFIEKNTFQGSDVIKIKELISKDKELQNRKIEFINEMQRQNKDMKISSIVDDVNCGRIIFNEYDTDFISQFKEFSGQATTLHDDAADCVSEFAKRISVVKLIPKVRLFDKRLLF